MSYTQSQLTAVSRVFPYFTRNTAGWNRPLHAMRIARRCRVCGRVQGVGFRFFVAAEAERLKVGGYVRNLDDGCVEAFIEGEEARVLALVELLRQGPHWSRVEEVQVEVMVPSGKGSRFQITG